MHYPLKLVLFAAFVLDQGNSACLACDAKDAPIQMDPVVISAETQLSFHFGLRIMRTQPGNHVFAVFINGVKGGSEAESVGLESQSKVVSIDGKSVEDYEGTFRPGSELNRIFIGRKYGDKVVLEVIPPGKTKQKTLVIQRKAVREKHTVNGIEIP